MVIPYLKTLKKRDLSGIFNDQNNEFDVTRLKKLDVYAVKRNPTIDNDFSTEKFTDVELNKNTIRFLNESPQVYLKVSFGNTDYNLT